jgi:hypothetical protein
LTQTGNRADRHKGISAQPQGFCRAIFGYDRVSTETAAYLVAIRARIRRSLEDPRPDMMLAEVDAYLAAVFMRAGQAALSHLK